MKTEYAGAPMGAIERVERVGPREMLYITGPLGTKRVYWDSTTTLSVRERIRKEMIRSVTHGYKEKIWIKGVGYRAEEVGGRNPSLLLSLGYRSPIEVGVPAGMTVKVKGGGTIIEVSGTNYQAIRQYQSMIVGLRPASKDKYNGKGVYFI